MWNLLPNDDQRMIADSVREYLAGELPIERLRPNAAAVDGEKARAGMAELGWFGVGLPESVGGAGLGLIEEMLIQRECGRFLVPPAMLATVLAGHVALHAGDTALSSDLAHGGVSVAVAIDASTIESGSILAFDWNGESPLLFWNAEGMGLFDASALSAATTEPCLDDSLSMQIGRLALDRPRHWVSTAKEPLARRADVLLAAAMVGLAEQACELAVEYAKVREQFGKPIGSFQAVKHRCADMGVRQRLAWYQTNLAALKIQADAADATLQVASAKLLSAEAAHENSRNAIQIHGGIGFQAECDVHWFQKRAHIYDQAGGSMAEQARRIIAEPAPVGN